MEGKWAPQIGKENKYGYNGKELNEEFGLDWNDYGARFYDPAIGKFSTIDPLSENYSSWSSYHYVYNNPMLYIDPDGRSIIISFEDDDGNTTEASYNVGDTYKGDNQYIKDAFKQLNYLAENAPTGLNIIETLANDESFTWGIEVVAPENILNGETFMGFNGSASSKSGYSTISTLLGVRTEEGGSQSPVQNVFHEAGHAYVTYMLGYYYDLLLEAQNNGDRAGYSQINQVIQRVETNRKQGLKGWGEREEKAVIQQLENVLSKQLGEDGRNSHKGKFYRTKGPFTTEPDS